MLFRIIQSCGAGYTKLANWAVQFAGSFLLVSVLLNVWFCHTLLKHQRAIAAVTEQAAVTQHAQYEWNHFHEGRYDTVLLAIRALVDHIAALEHAPPADVNDSEYFNMDGNNFGDPAAPH